MFRRLKIQGMMMRKRLLTSVVFFALLSTGTGRADVKASDPSIVGKWAARCHDLAIPETNALSGMTITEFTAEGSARSTEAHFSERDCKGFSAQARVQDFTYTATIVSHDEVKLVMEGGSHQGWKFVGSALVFPDRLIIKEEGSTGITVLTRAD